MRAFRAFAVKLAALAALVAGLTAVGLAPATAVPHVVAPSPWVPPIYGSPHVGAELALGEKVSGQCSNPPAYPRPEFVIEWLSNGVPLPGERQGDVLKLTPEDRGNRISMHVHLTCEEPKDYYSAETAPIAASNRATGWTNRGHYELLGRTHAGDLVLYPRTYEAEYRFKDMSTQALFYIGSWDEQRVVGTGWNIFNTVFSPGDFDGDGYNDVLGRDNAGKLFLYPGTGDGGWLPPKQVGAGWEIFDSIVGAGDFNGDGNNDVLGRDSAGRLFLYPGDGHGGWLAPSQIGSGWQIFDKIVGAGDTGHDGAVDIFARDRSGVLYQYPANGHGGWKSPSVVGHGFEVMTEIIGVGAFSTEYSYNASKPNDDITAVDREGDLHVYDGLSPAGLTSGGVVGIGWDIFKNLI